MTIAENVESARLARDMSQARLAMTLGVDENYVHCLERGDVKPSGFMATRLADALRVERERFIEDSTLAR